MVKVSRELDDGKTRQSEIYDFIKTLKPNMPDFEPGENLLESNLLDSVAMMELVLWSEEHFNFVVDTDDLTPDNFATLNAIVSYVNKSIEKS